MNRKNLTTTILVLALLAVPMAAQATLEDDILALMANANAELELQGLDYQLEVVEYYTAQDEQGQTVFFNNRGNKQLAFDFVPGDLGRTPWSGPVGPGDDIKWATDTSVPDGAAPGVGLGATQAAISRAMATWQNANCSNIPLNPAITVGNIGFLEWLIFGTGSPVIAGDIVHAGFGTLIDLLLPPPIIAATFTFIFTGTNNAAFREIYYTNNFAWGINTNSPIDIETVVLHEAGHGLSQGHFGKAFITNANGQLHFAPLAVMNAGYTGIQQSLAGTDNGGHCSIWGSWPNN